MKPLTLLTIILIISDLILAYYNFQLYGNKETQSREYVQISYRKLPEATEVPIEQLIYNLAGEYQVDPEVATRIAKAESSLNPKATNPNSSAKGLYQILAVHGLDDDCYFSKVCNARWAIMKMAENGFGAWESSRKMWE
jgi:soluble lytic murein transglycosylase-like protein